MAEIRNGHVQKHLQERQRIHSKYRQDKTPQNTIPYIYIKYNISIKFLVSIG